MQCKTNSMLRQHMGMVRYLLFLPEKEYPMHNHKICPAGQNCRLNLHTLLERSYTQCIYSQHFTEKGPNEDEAQTPWI